MPLTLGALKRWRNLLATLWPRPIWSDRTAKKLLGKTLLIGITRVTPDNEIIDRRQMHGHITEADPKRGILVTLQGSRFGEEYWLPPDLRSLKKAPKGEYKLPAPLRPVSDHDRQRVLPPPKAFTE